MMILRGGFEGLRERGGWDMGVEVDFWVGIEMVVLVEFICYILGVFFGIKIVILLRRL